MFILGLLWGIVTGLIISYYYNKTKINLEQKKNIGDISLKFKEVLSNLKKGNAVFVSRINHTVIVDTRISNLDIINLVYLMDKGVLCIFKDNQCLYTTESVDVDLASELLMEINDKFNNQINDVVNIMGMTISKEEFQLKIEEMKKWNLNNPNALQDVDIDQKSEIDEITNDNKIKFDIDEILDKISKFGLKSISEEELNYLNKQSKNL
jgi:hypothetical protein